MKEADVLRLLQARRDNYGIAGEITLVSGRVHSFIMNGEHYHAVVLVSSFEYYEYRYHLAKERPNLVVCYTHDTVLPMKCLSLRFSNLAEPYELPEQITDLEQQRWSRTGARVVLGAHMCGLQSARALMHDLPATTRKRYQARARQLSQRRTGKPVARGKPAQKNKLKKSG